VGDLIEIVMRSRQANPGELMGEQMSVDGFNAYCAIAPECN
jgi:hypothetical protein